MPQHRLFGFPCCCSAQRTPQTEPGKSGGSTLQHQLCFTAPCLLSRLDHLLTGAAHQGGAQGERQCPRAATSALGIACAM